MKTIYRVLVLGILMVAFTAVTVTPSFAQDPQEEKVALYKKYTDNYGGTLPQMEIAIEAGKQYIEKYGANEDDKDQVNYLKGAIPKLEETVKKIKANNIKKDRFNRFDTAVKSNKIADIFSVGKEIIANEPADSAIAFDATIFLASLGYDQAVKKDDTYNNETINFAKTVIQKVESGQTSENFGAYQYQYKNKEYPDGKNNTLGWMNYSIGYIMYYRQDKVKDSLTYFYKATQLNSATKGFSDIYRIFGLWYLEEALRIDKDRLAKIAAANNKDTDETLALLALQKGYADRSIDAYARAYNIASAKGSIATKEYKDALYSRLQDLFKFRFDDKITGIDAYVSTVKNKPMPDPATPVTPVVAATPTTATITPPATTTTTTKPPATTPTKPATTPTTTKPATTPTKPTSTTTTTKTDNNSVTEATTTKPTKSKTPAKKPVAKKKATR